MTDVGGGERYYNEAKNAYPVEFHLSFKRPAVLVQDTDVRVINTTGSSRIRLEANDFEIFGFIKERHVILFTRSSLRSVFGEQHFFQSEKKTRDVPEKPHPSKDFPTEGKTSEC